MNDYKELGAVTHIGQTETIAGEGAGERFNDPRRQEHPVRPPGADQRRPRGALRGSDQHLQGHVKSEFVGLDTDPAGAGGADRRPAAGQPRHRRLPRHRARSWPSRPSAPSQTAGRKTIIGGFDISPDLIDRHQGGDIAFTVDQQQYLQGYLPIVLMYLQATNLNTAGGGLPILTGPGFVDKDNVDAVSALVDKGTR